MQEPEWTQEEQDSFKERIHNLEQAEMEVTEALHELQAEFSEQKKSLKAYNVKLAEAVAEKAAHLKEITEKNLSSLGQEAIARAKYVA